ncbi:hypothetical protein QJS10_CPA05g01095 [Acorus calamus]|uniref:Transcription repressor n=1 Tax=Acorus calamus TaxID=4465 RepID=A0AAV9EUJ9_ACOCL|nr:hypothetical protein QJS10_CPA05g01095 [Acorus calamus]
MPISKGKLQKKCVEFCCGGRLSITSLDSADIDYEPDQMSCLTHAMAQARLDQMIKNQRQRRYAFERGRIRRATACDDVDYRCIMLVAMDKMSVDPVEDFRRSMFEVITSNGMDDPKTLRSLLSCYLSVNPRAHRSIILEIFHESYEVSSNDDHKWIIEEEEILQRRQEEKEMGLRISP